MFASTTWRFALFSLAAGLSACGPSLPTATIEPTVPVEGTLTYQGKPLEYHEIVFVPQGHRAAVGRTDANGKFVMHTNAENDGAAVGHHQVSVVYAGPLPDSKLDAAELPPPPPPSVKIPAKFKDAEKSGVTVDIPEGGIKDLKIDLK